MLGLGTLIAKVSTGSAGYKKFKNITKGLSAISGFFGSQKKRAEQAAKKASFQTLLGQQNVQLQNLIPEVQQEFAQQRQFLSEGEALQQQQATTQYGIAQEQIESQVGMTGLAGSGAGQEALMQAQQQFAVQQMARALQARETRYSLQQQEASRIRDIQSAGFALDRAAAEKGIKSSYGQSLLDITKVG